jgi:hypothetical protein
MMKDSTSIVSSHVTWNCGGNVFCHGHVITIYNILYISRWTARVESWISTSLWLDADMRYEGPILLLESAIH